MGKAMKAMKAMKAAGCEGCYGRHHRSRGGAAEEERKIQACWRLELEAQEEASARSKEGRESLHQGAMRLQGKARLEDSEGPPNEEAQGHDQLSVRLDADDS